MTRFRNITMAVALALALVWISGCGGCNPEPLPSGLNPAEGPETGGTTVRISGEKFDMKNSVTVTFGGKTAQSVTVPSKTEITAVTPAGTAGESVSVVVTNKKKADKPATLSGKFTYTDATPPTVTSTDPSDGTVISEYKDSLNVRNTVSITFSEDVDSGSGSVAVVVESTPDSISEEYGAVAGGVGGTGNTVTFTSNTPMRAGRKYTVTVSGVKDTAGNAQASSHTFSFSVSNPGKVHQYRVRKGDTLPMISARPEVYDDAKLWPRLVEANQDDYDFNPHRIIEGQWLSVPDRGEAWGDK
jgi:nucleoid-associated protein YgaU